LAIGRLVVVNRCSVSNVAHTSSLVWNGGVSMVMQRQRRKACANLCRALRGVGLAGLLFGASSTFGAWIDLGSQLGQGEVTLLIDTIPAGRPLTVTFTVADASALTPTVGTPDMQFQFGVRRPGGGPDLTATLNGVPASPNLVGPEPIPFTEISWTFIAMPSGAPNGTLPISGTNVPIGTNPISSLTTSTGSTVWAGGELRFSFTPSRVYRQGSYSGTVTFTAART
jgi:hypothetical protein